MHGVMYFYRFSHSAFYFRIISECFKQATLVFSVVCCFTILAGGLWNRQYGRGNGVLDDFLAAAALEVSLMVRNDAYLYVFTPIVFAPCSEFVLQVEDISFATNPQSGERLVLGEGNFGKVRVKRELVVAVYIRVISACHDWNLDVFVIHAGLSRSSLFHGAYCHQVYRPRHSCCCCTSSRAQQAQSSKHLWSIGRRF
jgi:hypothetical protein